MKYLSIIITILSLSIFPALAQKAAPPETTVEVETLLHAARDNDLVKFHSLCDENMKKAITAEKLTQVSAQISQLLKEGYKKTYLGLLKRGQVKTHLWKIDLNKAEAPDLLAELSILNDKVAGFIIR